MTDLTASLLFAGSAAIAAPVVAWLFGGDFRGTPSGILMLTALIWIPPLLLAAYLFTLAVQSAAP